MSRQILTVAVGAFVVSLVVVHHLTDQEARAERQKPIKSRSVHADGGVGAPETLEELWSMSPLVVDAVITASRPADSVLTTPRGEQTVTVRTAYVLKVNEVFRDSGGVLTGGAAIEVLQLGGDRDRGEYIESFTDPTSPKLDVAERYVFFLKRLRGIDPAGRTFVMASDTADSVLLLANDGTVKERGSGKVSRDLARFNHLDLLNRLRDLSPRRAPAGSVGSLGF